jgi:hypothetical protein
MNRLSEKRIEKLEKKFKPEKKWITIYQDIEESMAGLNKYYYMDKEKGKTEITLEEAHSRFNEESYNLIVLTYDNTPIPEENIEQDEENV